ncbi:hypothetical protein D3P09_16705 [Paenibacillus pinisoli]|uniref:WXG100 family type VII secretion target n=1 Tax=Paenibacillus pinisoli TaxID=1276110 RepID=A0A3A6PCK2_9BACL|nr:hypothetical protein [Paenibacillus pinisoli]RJX39132.1 hypothetical protein D3P09_16705 [Paenibacillus pinisoli]
MGINVVQANSQASSISRYASDLRGIKSSLLQYKSEINSAWQSREMKYVNQALDKLNIELSTICSDLDSLSSDIVAVAREIQQEEEAARRAAEERARLEAEARARQQQSTTGKKSPFGL